MTYFCTHVELVAKSIYILSADEKQRQLRKPDRIMEETEQRKVEERE